MKQFVRDYFLAIVFFVGAIIALVINVNYEARINRLYNTFLYPKTPLSSAGTGTVKTQGNKVDIKGIHTAILEPDKKLRCTFRSDAENAVVSGNFLTDGTNLKSYVTARVNDVYSENNGLVLAKETYIWPSGSEEGIKITNDKVPSITDINPVSELFVRAGIGSVYDFTCYEWESYDKNAFVIPINVSFTDISETIGKLLENPCMVCNSMSDKTKQESCKKVYNCK